MRKPPLTFDAILAALAVLTTGAGCSKADRATAEPPAAAPATNAPAATAATPAAPSAQPPTAAAPPSPAAAPAAAEATPAVDAGSERKMAPKAAPSKGASAACGATGCSAEMRKGGK